MDRARSRPPAARPRPSRAPGCSLLLAAARAFIMPPHPAREEMMPDVIIVGAGLSGIAAACHLQRQCPWLSFVLLEARSALGGTWDIFRYPGVRSDSDMYTLGFNFRPWDGTKAIAPGPDILRYLQDTAEENGLLPRIRFGHRVVSAAWTSENCTWRINVVCTPQKEAVELECNFVFMATGYYDTEKGYLPEFPGGLGSFGGKVIHPVSMACSPILIIHRTRGLCGALMVARLSRTTSYLASRVHLAGPPEVLPPGAKAIQHDTDGRSVVRGACMRRMLLGAGNA
jgi:hypothetical protein